MDRLCIESVTMLFERYKLELEIQYWNSNVDIEVNNEEED